MTSSPRPQSMLAEDGAAPVNSALKLIGRMLDADVCCLLWHARDGGLHTLDLSESQVTPGLRRAWLRQSAATPKGQSVRGEDGLVVAPVRRTDGGVRGCLALRVRTHRTKALADGAVAAAGYLGGLLSVADQFGERPSAYHALFEIGMQIQAAESRPDAIFALIVERGRQLLATDVAWLAMVEPGGSRLAMKVAAGTTTPGFMAMAVDVGTGIGGIALEQQRPVAVRDIRSYAPGMPTTVRGALEDEGVTSILCAPMLRDGGMLGALYVGTRSPVGFTSEAASLLSALAAQAAVTIDNARLYQALSQQNDLLERVNDVHRALTDASLSGMGAHQIGMMLAGLVGRDLVLAQDTILPGRVLYPCHGTEYREIKDAGSDEDFDGEAAPLTAAGVRLGSLRASGAGQLSPLQRNSLEYGATVLTLELVKAQAELEVEWRLQGELLEELLRSDTPTDGLLRRAKRFGVDLTTPRRMIALEARDEASSSRLLLVVHRMFQQRDGTSLVAQRGDRVLVALADDPVGDVDSVLGDLRALEGRCGIAACAGVSRARSELALATREAESALQLALQSGRPNAIVSYDDLGPLIFLLDAPNTDSMQDLVTEYLGDVARHDAEHQSELLFTLQNFLASGGNGPTTADVCGIHTSTLKYRLSRMSDILGESLKDPTVRFRLSLAFEILTLLKGLQCAPPGFSDVPARSEFWAHEVVGGSAAGQRTTSRREAP